MNPSARLSASLLLGLVLWLPTLGPCMRGDIGLPEAGVRYLLAFGFVSLALGGISSLIRAYGATSDDDGSAMVASGTDDDQTRLRRSGEESMSGAGPA